MPAISAAGAGSSTRDSARCPNSFRSSCRSRSAISGRPKWCWSSSPLSTCVPHPKAWLEFVRADVAETFDGAEGVLFFAAPDALAGLVTWATFDNNAADAVASPFGSGCSSVVAQAVQENRNGRPEVFSGPFRPFGPAVGGAGCFELRRSDVPLSGDVRHDACKLSVRYACVEQSSRTD